MQNNSKEIIFLVGNDQIEIFQSEESKCKINIIRFGRSTELNKDQYSPANTLANVENVDDSTKPEIKIKKKDGRGSFSKELHRLSKLYQKEHPELKYWEVMKICGKEYRENKNKKVLEENI